MSGFTSNLAFNNSIKKRIDSLETVKITKGKKQDIIQVLNATFRIKKIQTGTKQIEVIGGSISILSGELTIISGMLNLSSGDHFRGITMLSENIQLSVSSSELFVTSTTNIGEQIFVSGYVKLVNDSLLVSTSMDLKGNQCCDTSVLIEGTTTINLLNTTKNYNSRGEI
jgi:hypothetical protein